MISKKRLLCTVLFIFSTICFSQTLQEDYGTLENESSLLVQGDLQNNFIILADPHVYEFNPHLTSIASDNHLLMNIYEGLFTYNPTSAEPEFAIATDYRISRDKKRWTFSINPNAFFSNGEKITAKSVRDSWITLLSTPHAPYSSLLDVIKGAREFRLGEGSVEDVGIYSNSDDTLTVHLVKPANYLPKVLCHVAFSVVPPKVQMEQNVGSGAYYIKSYGDYVCVLSKSPFYWDKSSSHFENVTILQCADPDENAHLFNIGVADWVIADTNLDKIINKKAFQINAQFGTSYLFFKKNEKSYWNYPELRAALFEIIPWDDLRSNFYFPAQTFVYPLNGYPEVEGFNFTDENEALILMKSAREKYGIPADLQIPLVIEISQRSLSEQIISLMKEKFLKIGVELTVRELPVNIYFNNIKSSSADIFLYSWIGDFADPLAFLELFRSDSSLNESMWSNEEFDNLLDEASVVTEEERNKLLAQAEDILLDDFMIIPIQHPVSFNIINLEEVGGWFLNPVDIHQFKYLYKKPSEKKRADVVIFRQ